MPQSLAFDGNYFWDSSAIEMMASSAANRKTLADWASGINNTLNHTIDPSDSVLLKFASGTSGFAFLNSVSDDAAGVYGIGCTSGGTAFFREIVPCTDIALTRSGANVRFSNNNANSVDMLVILTKGSYTV